MAALDISPEYGEAPITLKPYSSRLHRLVAILADTYYDDLTDDRIAQLETLAQSWRWMGADRALTDEEIALHDAIKSKATELETLFDQVKPGRYRSLGMTALEESVMWAVKELTS
jgi:hypothetical protein